MRTFLTVLAALAAATTASAQVAFDKSSCTRTNFPTDAYTFEPSTDGSWSCVNFDVAQGAAAAMKIQVPLSMDGAEMQVVMWNSAQQGGATGTSSVWNEAGGGSNPTASWDSLYHLNPQGQGGDLTNFDPSVPDPGSNSTRQVTMQTVFGSNSNSKNNGVYAYVTQTNIQLNLDTNYLQITHPDDDSSHSPARTGQNDYEGIFMWRFVDPRVDSIVNANPLQVSSQLSPAQIESSFGALAVGGSVSINNFLLPGSYVNVKPDSPTIINNALPLRKFGYKVSISGTGVGNVTQVGNTRLIFTNSLPIGYSDNTNLVSFSSNGLNSYDLAGGQEAWYNITDPDIMDDLVRNVTFADSATTLQVYYNKPLDTSTSQSTLDSTGFGSFQVQVPDFESQTYVGIYDWTNQASPFVNVQITLTDFETYPRLSSLSNLRLRNHGIDEDEGHSLASPVNQVPFAIYLVETDASAYTARVAFSNVVNLNNEDGVAPSASDASTSVSPGCDPLWEVQVINGARYLTTSNRRPSGWSRDWSNPLESTATGGLNFYSANWINMQSSRGIQDSSHTIPALKRTVFENYGNLVANPATRRSVWLLVRISAARPVLSGGTQQCGSNWVQIGSASWQTTSPYGQCRSSSDCTVNSADNPNEGQASDSANGAANRFSTCMLLPKVSNGMTVPTTKCVECMSDAQCDGGQYCHVDDGICTNALGQDYVCDQPSYDRMGLCRAKSTDVLGARCTPNFEMNMGSTFGSTPTYTTPVTTWSVEVPGGSRVSWRNAGNQFFSVGKPNHVSVIEGDADNSDFAPGARGACGEFRFWNSSVLPTNADARTLTGASIDGLWSAAGRVRTTLWNGLCVNLGGNLGHRCVECMPGSGINGAAAGSSTPGKICLNGRNHAARDVDGTVRSYTTDTNASTELGTTMMIVLLIFLYATHMYAEAKRWRIANGKKPMTCCECICCCGVCSSEGGEAPASSGDKTTAQTAPAPAAETGEAADASGDADV